MTKKQYKVIIDNLDEYSVLRYDGSIVSTEITNKAVAELFCDELNEQDERIKELEDENEQLKQKIKELEDDVKHWKLGFFTMIHKYNEMEVITDD